MKRFLFTLAVVLVGITAEAQLVRSSALTVIKEKLPPVELGWKHIVDGQVGVGTYDGFEPMVNVHYIAGYRFSQHLLGGVATGVEYHGAGVIDVGEYDTGYLSLPLYLHGRYYFTTERWSPYVGASAGFNFASKRAYLNKVWSGYEVVGDNPPFVSSFVDINLGANHRLDAQRELSIYAGLRVMNKRDIYVYVAPSYGSTGPEQVFIDREGFSTVLRFYLGTSISF